MGEACNPGSRDSGVWMLGNVCLGARTNLASSHGEGVRLPRIHKLVLCIDLWQKK